MKTTIKNIRNNGMYAAALLVAVGSAACGAAASEDVAYEDDYPGDVAYAGVYAGGFGYYAATPAGTGASEQLPATLLDGGHISFDGGHVTIDGGQITVDAGRAADAGGRGGTGATTVRGAVGQAIRNAA